MAYRIFSAVLVVMALVLFAAQPAMSAGEKSHEGKVVKAGDGKLTMTFKADDKERTLDVAKDAKISVDAKQATLEDLKGGQQVEVWMDTKRNVTKIEARSK
jgi:hypothetical protein